MYVVDNFHTVLDGRVYRSGQPDEDEIRRWAPRYGLRTLINLRGGDEGEGEAQVTEEMATAKELNLTYISIHLPNTALACSEDLQKLAVALESAGQPLLVHCKAGADRTSLASVMAAMALGGESFQQALRQSSWRFLHFDGDPQHITGCLDQYQEYCRDKRGGDTGGWPQFRQWLFEEYRGGRHHSRKETAQATPSAP
jgi:uncharacterized protein (TIGR01244 family)